MSLHDPYLESKISLHFPFTSTSILYFHLANKAVLNIPTSLIPKPRVSIGEHTLSHATHAIFLPSCPQTERNLACIFLIQLHTSVGGSALITDLRRQILPTMDKIFPFQEDNLLLIFSIIGFQNDTLLGLPPIVIPR